MFLFIILWCDIVSDDSVAFLYICTTRLQRRAAELRRTAARLPQRLFVTLTCVRNSYKRARD